MPLLDNAEYLIRANLERFSPTTKVRVTGVVIGTLTAEQLDAVNENRRAQDLRLVIAEVLFFGWHSYKSRVIKDGYDIDDVVDQIASAMSPDSKVIADDYMTAIQNPLARADRYGNMVNDRAVLECSARHPRPELFSVMPKGDAIKPRQAKRPPVGVAFQSSSDSPG